MITIHMMHAQSLISSNLGWVARQVELIALDSLLFPTAYPPDRVDNN